MDGEPKTRSRSARLAMMLVTLAVVGLTAGQSAWAQAETSAGRKDAISVFAGGSFIDTDYSADDFGYMAGADYTRNFRRFSAGIEGRYTGSNGNSVKEHSFIGGLKAEKGFQSFHPYVDLELGYGVIQFIPGTPTYNRDNSIVYDVGLGLDYRVSGLFSVMLDAQQQHWNLGQSASILNPYNINLGLVYRIPFGVARHRR